MTRTLIAVLMMLTVYQWQWIGRGRLYAQLLAKQVVVARSRLEPVVPVAIGDRPVLGRVRRRVDRRRHRERRHVPRGDPLAPCQVRDRPRQAQDPVVGSRRQPELPNRRLQEIPRGVVTPRAALMPSCSNRRPSIAKSRRRACPTPSS